MKFCTTRNRRAAKLNGANNMYLRSIRSPFIAESSALSIFITLQQPITSKVIRMTFCSLMLESDDGNDPHGQNMTIYQDFLAFYDNHYKTLGYTEKINGLHLSHILAAITKEMVTAINNNIRLHFDKYLKCYIRAIHS